MLIIGLISQLTGVNALTQSHTDERQWRSQAQKTKSSRKLLDDPGSSRRCQQFDTWYPRFFRGAWVLWIGSEVDQDPAINDSIRIKLKIPFKSFLWNSVFSLIKWKSFLIQQAIYNSWQSISHYIPLSFIPCYSQHTPIYLIHIKSRSTSQIQSHIKSDITYIKSQVHPI